jgi:hypothetical protein
MSKISKKAALNDADAQARANVEYFYYARDNGHDEYCQLAKKCTDFFKGKQWSDADLSKLKSQGRPHVTYNQIKSTAANILGEHLANRLDVMFRPVKNGKIEVAGAIDKVWLNIANNNKVDALETKVLLDGILTSRGYYEQRIDFDDQMRGEVKITSPRSTNVILDPEIEFDDPKTWPCVTDTKWLSLNDIETLHGAAIAERVKHISPNSCLGPDMLYQHVRPEIRYGGAKPEEIRMYRMLSRQYRKARKMPHFVDIETGDLRRVPEGWDRERIGRVLELAQGQAQVIDRIVTDVYWCQSIDSVSVHDDWSPYKNFTIVPYFPFFVDGTPIGIVSDLLGPQEMLNKVSSQEMHILNTSASSGWMVKNGSLSNMTVAELQKRGAETGLVLVYNGEQPPEKIQPNQVPTGHDRLSFKANEFLKEISGVTDTMRGQDREDVSSKAIVAKQARGAVGLAVPFANLMRSRQMLAENALDLIQEYYTEPRVLQITGGTVVAPTTETLEINMPTPEGEMLNDLTLGEYCVVVSPTQSRSTTDESDFAQLLQLRELGIPIPDAALVLASNAPNKVDLAKSLGADTSGDMAEQAKFERRQAEIEAMAIESENRKRMADAALSEARAMKAQGEAKLAPEELALEAEAKREEARNKRTQSLLQAESLKIQREKQRHDAVMGAAKLQADERKSERDAKAKSAAAKKKPATKKPTPKRKS